MKQRLTESKRETSNSIIIVGDFKTLLSMINIIIGEIVNKKNRRLEQHYKPTRLN